MDSCEFLRRAVAEIESKLSVVNRGLERFELLRNPPTAAQAVRLQGLRVEREELEREGRRARARLRDCEKNLGAIEGSP